MSSGWEIFLHPIPMATYPAVKAVEGRMEVQAWPHAIHLQGHLQEEEPKEQELCIVWKRKPSSLGHGASRSTSSPRGTRQRWDTPRSTLLPPALRPEEGVGKQACQELSANNRAPTPQINLRGRYTGAPVVREGQRGLAQSRAVPQCYMVVVGVSATTLTTWHCRGTLASWT